MTFDLDFWPTDLNINRGHLLIKDYLHVPTKFEASGAKHSWVISCTRWSRLAWPLTLTFDLLTWISIGVIYSSRTIYLPSLKLLGQSVLALSVAQGEVDWLDLDLWPTDLNINRGHLLIKDYLPTKFEASWSKHSWVISCTKLRDTDIPTDMCKAICPSFFKGGHKNRGLGIKYALAYHTSIGCPKHYAYWLSKLKQNKTLDWWCPSVGSFINIMSMASFALWFILKSLITKTSVCNIIYTTNNSKSLPNLCLEYDTKLQIHPSKQ